MIRHKSLDTSINFSFESQNHIQPFVSLPLYAILEPMFKEIRSSPLSIIFKLIIHLDKLFEFEIPAKTPSRFYAVCCSIQT